VLPSEPVPFAILFCQLVLRNNEEAPSAVLLLPFELDNALAPMAELLLAVVFHLHA
jgi:hypothetical protein